MDLKSLVNDNQSIKIVPSVEDIVRQNGFNTDLDGNTLIRFNHLKTTWHTWKRSVAVKNELYEIFNTVPDPFSVALVMVVKCEDFKDCKPKTLPYCIVEEIDSWKRLHKQIPTNNLKLTAFHIAAQQRNQDFLNLIVQSYDIKTEKAAVLPLVQDMIEQGIYKQALQSAMSMELFDDIPVEDLLFPLVLQDKGSMIDNYLMLCPQQAKNFIFYIDKLLDRSISIRDTIQNYVTDHDIIDVKWDKLYHKPLGKLVARLCAKFKVPLQDCKNLSKNRTTGGLRYLIGQKYQEKNVSDSAWNDLVKDSLEQNPEAADDFVNMLIDYDVKEALKWAEYLELPIEKYPAALLDLKSDSSSSSYPERLIEENWDDEPGPSQEFYKLSISKDKICIIDNTLSFCSLIEENLQYLQFVCIDCEWKPSFGASQSKVALIQIATLENVYLIDFTSLNNPECTNAWQIFITRVIDNAEIIKVGFGLEHDIREMKNTFLSSFNLKMKGEGFLDLSNLSKCLVKGGLKLPYSTEGSGGSLSCLTQACFGLPLMKHEQCSNWEVRPLRQSQIEYASLDAYVLIEIYTFLQDLSYKQNIKYEEICYNVMEKGKQKNVKKNKTQIVDTKAKVPNLIKPIDKINLMVDCDLYPVVKYLRFCGLDTTVIEKDTLWHNAVNEAISEDRYIVLSKMKFTPTTKYSQNKILVVPKGDVKYQLIDILNNFQVRIPPENFYRRCVLCNSMNMTVMSNDEIKEMYARFSEDKPTVTDLSYSNLSYGRDRELDHFMSDAESDEELYQPVSVHKRSSVEQSDVWLTKEKAKMKIEEVANLPPDYQDPIFLCETCGKFYWYGNYPIEDVGNLISELPLS